MQNIDFQEYDLPNGLHIILHQDKKAPVVAVGVMYKVGAKNDPVGKTGFAHFFEHLLFEGTQNIPRGEWFNIVARHGGKNNAFTTADKTYYYEIFPSNHLQLALWMEAERMRHPVINQIGVDTQRNVIKEEKRQRLTNAPYGKIVYRTEINPYLFKNHPYRQSVIGKMADLDTATTADFQQYNQLYYNPNNAVLVVAGAIDFQQTKQWINDYFLSIENKSPKPNSVEIQEEIISSTIKKVAYDANIQLPIKIFAYRTPKMTDFDAFVFDFISTLLTGGKSSRMYKKMVDEQKQAVEVVAFNDSQEDYGVYIMGAIPLGETSLEVLAQQMDYEIEKLQSELISDNELEKLQNTYENNFVDANATMEGIALSLANNYMFMKNTNFINEQLSMYRTITKEDIQRVAKKYLAVSSRLELDYLPQQ